MLLSVSSRGNYFFLSIKSLIQRHSLTLNKRWNFWINIIQRFFGGMHQTEYKSNFIFIDYERSEVYNKKWQPLHTKTIQQQMFIKCLKPLFKVYFIGKNNCVTWVWGHISDQIRSNKIVQLMHKKTNKNVSIFNI